VIYKVTAYYDPSSERGLAWDDPEIGIVWPVNQDNAVMTERDRTFSRLTQLPEFFTFANFPN
jgi:dTDP-4-dehydrorhamnose 3,5-epimerase